MLHQHTLYITGKITIYYWLSFVHFVLESQITQYFQREEFYPFTHSLTHSLNAINQCNAINIVYDDYKQLAWHPFSISSAPSDPVTTHHIKVCLLHIIIIFIHWTWLMCLIRCIEWPTNDDEFHSLPTTTTLCTTTITYQPSHCNQFNSMQSMQWFYGMNLWTTKCKVCIRQLHRRTREINGLNDCSDFHR